MLDILGSYSFERVFPVDANTEARTREAGLHLWYTVKFNKGTDLKAAAERNVTLIIRWNGGGDIVVNKAVESAGYTIALSQLAELVK